MGRGRGRGLSCFQSQKPLPRLLALTLSPATASSVSRGPRRRDPQGPACSAAPLESTTTSHLTRTDNQKRKPVPPAYWLPSTRDDTDRVVLTRSFARPDARTQSLGRKRAFEPGFLLLALLSPSTRSMVRAGLSGAAQDTVTACASTAHEMRAALGLWAKPKCLRASPTDRGDPHPP